MGTQVDTSMYQNMPNPMERYGQSQDMILRAGQMKLQQLEQQGIQLQNAKTKLDMIRNVLAAHANDPGVSRESILRSAGDLIAQSNGAISPQGVAQALSTMPDGGPALKAWLNQKNTEMLSADQRLGQVIQMNDGQRQHLMRILPNNQVQEMGTLQNNLSPAESATQQPQVGTDPRTGQPTMGAVPLSSVVTPQGQAPGAGGGQSGGFQQNPAVLPVPTPLPQGGATNSPIMPGGATGMPAPVQTGQVDPLSPQANAPALQAYRQGNGMATPAREGGPSTGANNMQGYQQEVENAASAQAPQVSASALQPNSGATSRPSAPPITPNTPASSPNVPAGWRQTQLTPGVQQAADAAGTASGATEAQAMQRAQGLPQRLYQLKTALNGLQNTTTGPGTAETNAAKSFLLAQVPFAKNLAPDTVNSVASYDEANKYLTQYAQSSAANFGPETDAKLAASLTGNANTHISNLASQDVVKANIGLERMQAAQTAAWQQAKQSGQYTDADYNSFVANSSKTLDPRAFMLDVMTPQQRQGLFSGLESGNPTDKANFAASLELANQTGLMPAPAKTTSPAAGQQPVPQPQPDGGQ